MPISRLEGVPDSVANFAWLGLPGSCNLFISWRILSKGSARSPSPTAGTEAPVFSLNCDGTDIFETSVCTPLRQSKVGDMWPEMKDFQNI